MARASGKKIGAGAKGKGSGAGAMAPPRDDLLQENQVLANRDKQPRGRNEGRKDQRGQDSKWVESEQRSDHAANRLPDTK